MRQRCGVLDIRREEVVRVIGSGTRRVGVTAFPYRRSLWIRLCLDLASWGWIIMSFSVQLIGHYKARGARNVVWALASTEILLISQVSIMWLSFLDFGVRDIEQQIEIGRDFIIRHFQREIRIFFLWFYSISSSHEEQRFIYALVFR